MRIAFEARGAGDRRPVVGLESAQLLLVRGRDLVVMGVRGRGFQASGSSLIAGVDAALIVTLPPQAIGELPAAADSSRAAARFGGPSELTLSVAPGTQVPLTVEGMLQALSDAGIVTTGAVDEHPLAIELPWRLVLAPRPAASAEVFAIDLPARAIDGPSGGTGLWRLRLDAASGLALLPIPPFAGDDDGFVPPLDADDRNKIAANGGVPGQEPTAPSIELTALGGSLAATGAWNEFAWEQRTVLGRDMAIHTEEKGVLYPFGHRAVLVKATERVLVPSPLGTGVVAALQETETLIVSDPVSRPAAHGMRAARQFPFETVEILGKSFQLGAQGEQVVLSHDRLPKRLDDLIRDLDDAITKSQEDDQRIADERQGLHDLGVQNAQADLDAAGVALAEANAVLEPLQQQQDDFDAFVAHDHTGIPTGPPSDAVVVGAEDSGTVTTGDTGNTGERAPRPPDPVALQQAKDDVAAAGHAVLAAQDALTAARAATPTEDDVAAESDALAELVAEARQLRQQIPEKKAHLEQVKAEAQADLNLTVIGWPLAPDGSKLQFPVRCGDVTFRLPLLLVHDLRYPDTEEFPAYVSLTDSDVLDTARSTWNADGHGSVPLPGVRINLVPGSQPHAADVHEVHEIEIVGGPKDDPDPIRPILDGFEIDLPAVRTLLPTAPSRLRAAFDSNYLERGEVADVALRLPVPLGVNFSSATDRAGALIAPVFKADVISRAHGLVDSALLPGALSGPPSLATVFAGAKLLGVDLASVIDGPPEPLGVVPVLDGVRPVGARMAWNLKLTDGGPLRTKPTTALTLRVERSPAKTETTCTIVDVGLVLPPSGAELIRLDFGAVTFTQTADRPPHLEVDGVSVTLGGVLDLLRTLEDALDLGSALPAVQRTPRGISASYALELPEVGAGAFTLSNIAVHAGIDVPFDGHPVVASLSFASRDDPFNLSVLTFGGGGYLSFEIAEKGIRRLEASLDFGARVSIGVGLASAEVHALGGVRFIQAADAGVTAVGFLNIGGSVDVLGLVSVSVELEVDLAYAEIHDPHTGALIGEAMKGRATLVIEVDVTFWSGAIELDSGEYTFAGPPPPDHAAPSIATTTSEPTLEEWQDYVDKFAPMPA